MKKKTSLLSHRHCGCAVAILWRSVLIGPDFISWCSQGLTLLLRVNTHYSLNIIKAQLQDVKRVDVVNKSIKIFRSAQRWGERSSMAGLYIFLSCSLWARTVLWWSSSPDQEISWRLCIRRQNIYLSFPSFPSSACFGFSRTGGSSDNSNDQNTHFVKI